MAGAEDHETSVEIEETLLETVPDPFESVRRSPRLSPPRSSPSEERFELHQQVNGGPRRSARVREIRYRPSYAPVDRRLNLADQLTDRGRHSSTPPAASEDLIESSPENLAFMSPNTSYTLNGDAYIAELTPEHLITRRQSFQQEATEFNFSQPRRNPRLLAPLEFTYSSLMTSPWSGIEPRESR